VRIMAPGNATIVWLRLDLRLEDNPALRWAASRWWLHQSLASLAARDTRVARDLAAAGLEVADFNAHLLFEATAVRTQGGGPFQVFTPFWKACLAVDAFAAIAAGGGDGAGPRSVRRS